MSGRIRTIKPELIEDEKTASLADDEFRLFIGLFLLADDFGNFRANPVWLQGQVFWCRTTSRDPREMLATLSGLSLIQLYEVHGQQYGHICGWSKHQKVDHPSRPRVPGPTAKNTGKTDDVGQPRETLSNPREEFASPRETLGNDLRSPISDLIPPIIDLIPPSRVSATDDMIAKPQPSAPLSPPSADAAKQNKRGRKPKSETPLPADWQPNDKHREMAKAAGLDVVRQSEQFRDHHTAKGSVFKNWDAAFRTWLRNAEDWRSGARLPLDASSPSHTTEDSHHYACAAHRPLKLKPEPVPPTLAEIEAADAIVRGL